MIGAFVGESLAASSGLSISTLEFSVSVSAAASELQIAEVLKVVFESKQLTFNPDWTADMYHEVFMLLRILFERTDMDVNIAVKQPRGPESKFQDKYENTKWFQLWVKFSGQKPRFKRFKCQNSEPEHVEYLEFTKRRDRQQGDENMSDIKLGAYREMIEKVLSHTFQFPCTLNHYGLAVDTEIAEKLEQSIETLQILDLPKFDDDESLLQECKELPDGDQEEMPYKSWVGALPDGDQEELPYKSSVGRS